MREAQFLPWENVFGFHLAGIAGCRRGPRALPHACITKSSFQSSQLWRMIGMAQLSARIAPFH